MSEAAATADLPEQPETRRYDLFLRHGTGFYWRLRDSGVTPEADRLVYPVEGRMGWLPYADIVSVNLSSGLVPRSGRVSQCLVTFRNGARLAIVTATAAGYPDPARNGIYATFLEDFHRRLIESGAARHITFTSGSSATRAMVLHIALAAGGLLFIVLPVILAMVIGSMEPLWPMLAGLLFLWPAFEVARKNRPGRYNPAYPPNMLER